MTIALPGKAFLYYASEPENRADAAKAMHAARMTAVELQNFDLAAAIREFESELRSTVPSDSPFQSTKVAQ